MFGAFGFVVGAVHAAHCARLVVEVLHVGLRSGVVVAFGVDDTLGLGLGLGLGVGFGFALVAQRGHGVGGPSHFALVAPLG